MNRAVRIIVKGLVQGVCFRLAARSEAERLGLSGWVRNCSDGSVEVEAEGPDLALKKMAEWCRKGPVNARVTDIRVDYMPADGRFEGFEIRR